MQDRGDERRGVGIGGVEQGLNDALEEAVQDGEEEEEGRVSCESDTDILKTGRK